jgi:glycerol-3-phosphate acyltransferase PlsY
VLAVVAGHVWPVQIGFRGGKGIAPFLGALVVAEPRFVLAFAVGFALIFVLVRRFTLAGLVAVALLPATVPWLQASALSVAGLAACALLILIAHRRNLREEIAKFLSRRRRPDADASAAAPAPNDRRTPHRV